MKTIIDITKLKLILGKLFYLATACSHLLSVCLKYKIFKCNEQRDRSEVRLRAESKHMPMFFLRIVKTAVAASMELTAVMQRDPSEQRCELSDKIMSLYLNRHSKNTLPFSAHKRILMQSVGSEKK
jgi:hypothetical protein